MLERFIPQPAKIFLKRLISCATWDQWANYSWSQEGEDLLLRRIFGEHKTSGLFIDVGAHHPMRFSNTQLFYRTGWRGINIDPNPGTALLFRRYRPDDITLEVGISDAEGRLQYWVFDEPALNSFDRELVEKRIRETRYRPIRVLQIEVLRLETVLHRYLPPGAHIDFMTIDVEGYDLPVLRSNDWTLFRPQVLLVEQLNVVQSETIKTEVHDFLRSHGYQLCARTVSTCVYRDTFRK